MKFVEAANNFTNFVVLANNFWKVHNTCKNFMKFVDWKVRSKCLKVFLLNINVSQILFTDKLNKGRYKQVDKIFGTVKRCSLVALDRWSSYSV